MSTGEDSVLRVFPTPERDVLRLSPWEWVAVLIGAAGLLVAVPSMELKGRSTAVEPDYRIPYALSHRYRLYRHYTTLAALQYPALIVGDSVVWGQCAPRDRTLSHHLNEQICTPCFANAGLDAMHPIALEGLLEFHAPAITRKNVIIQFNPLWLMQQGQSTTPSGEPLANRPNLVPRLVGGSPGSRQVLVESAWSRLAKIEPIRAWTDQVLGSQMDFLSWSITHPYENPTTVLTTPLPPSEDTFPQRLVAWNSGADAPLLSCSWTQPLKHGQWLAFERILDRLEIRGDRVLVVVGPMNEHMMTPESRQSYRSFIAAVGDRLRARRTAFTVPPVLASDRYADLCHPLAEGYEELARQLIRDQAAWMEEILACRPDPTRASRK